MAMPFREVGSIGAVKSVLDLRGQRRLSCFVVGERSR